MSPFTWPVLGGAAVLSAPALWRATVEGTTNAEDALIRYLVGVVVCWLLLSTVVALVGPGGMPERTPTEDEPAVL